MTTALDRAIALALCGWDEAADVPDWLLAERLADLGECGGDALTARRGLALGGAVERLVELAAHEGDGPHGACPECGGLLESHAWRRRRWCPRCREHRLPGPTRQALAEALAAALAEAGDVRVRRVAEAIGRSDGEQTKAYLIVGVLTFPYHCSCGAVSRGVDGGRQAYCVRCGWSGPASALLPPLLTREGLDRRVAAKRAARG